MKKYYTIFLLLITLNVSVSEAQTMTREEFEKLPRVQISNAIPDSNFISVLNDSTITGRVLSSCDGQKGHLGSLIIGVIKIQPKGKKIIYSILTLPNYNYDFKVGDNVNVAVSPLHTKDAYYKSGISTCDIIKGDILCIVKK